MATQPTLISSVVRALSLLDAVGDAGAPVTAKRLSRATGIPLATTYHLLRTLVHEGYLARSPDGYVLGDHAWVLGHRAKLAGPPRARTHPILDQLRQDAGAAAYLAVIDDGEVVLTDIADAPATPRVDLWVGFHEAAHATALGKAVLAALPARDRVDYLHRHALADLTPHTITDRRRLLAELDAHRGTALDEEEYALGTACLAMTVRSPALTAAVAVSVPARQAHALAHRVPALRRAARQVALAVAITI